ncbi:MAG: ComEC/Rec2 family competence protein [Myxococcales bacterium]
MAIAAECPLAPETVALLAPLPVTAACLLLRWQRPFWAQAIVACWVGLYAEARALIPPALPAPLGAVVDHDTRAVVQGWVLTAPEAVTPREGSRLRVAIERVDARPARATVALAVAAGIPTLLPGDAIEFRANLRSVRGLANPGLVDSAIQARAAGIDLFAGVGASENIHVLPGGLVGFPSRPATVVWRAAARVRLALGHAIDRIASPRAATFLHTAVLGERRTTDPTVEDGFRAAGATHVLSVSGLHLAAVGLVFFDGVRRLLVVVPRLPLWIDARATAAALAVPALAFYTLVTGAAVATVRSMLMMLFGLVGVALGRRNTPLIAVAAAVLLLLAWSPLVITDISFQLSAVSVLALAVLVPRLLPSRGDPPTLSSLARAELRAPWLKTPLTWLGGLAAATVAAGVTTAPVVAHHFGEVTPAAPLGNLVLVPLVEMVVVPFGLLGATVGCLLGTTCSLPLLKVADTAARLALWAAEGFRNHAPVWLTRELSTFETLTSCLGLACLLACIRRPLAAGARPLLVLGGVFIGAALASGCGREVARRMNSNLIITFLDVGQGDAAVLQLPGGATLLIDGGGTYDGSFDPGARVVEPFLRRRGITHLEVVALSHPHPDHLGGLHRVVERFPVETLWTSGDDGHNPDYLRLMATARARGVSRPVPALWQRAGVTIAPLGPYVTDRGGGADEQATERIGVPEGATVNDASLVIRSSFGGRALLFTGDIEANGEGELSGRVAVGQDVRADILKVPHHGSRTSSTEELLDAVRPRLAVISLGWRNRFHFPRPEVVERYRRRGISLLRTDQNGAVTVTIQADGRFDTTCERGCR